MTHITLPPMYDFQIEVYQCPARFRVLAKGRRAGGSYLAIVEAIAEMLRGGYVWYISSTYPNSTERWEELKSLVNQIDGVDIRESERKITYRGRGMIEVKAATVGDGLRGAGVTLIICDEVPFWIQAGIDPKYLWTQVLSPMLGISKGRALFLSSPNGIDFFQELHWLGDQTNPNRLPDWQSFTFASSANPDFAPEEIRRIRDGMTELEALQELDAQFVDLTGTVFRRVRENAIATRQDQAIPGHTYIISVDLAKVSDYSVFGVFDATLVPPSLVYMDRQNQVNYKLQVKRLKELCDRFNPQAVIVEANNVGSAVLEEMQVQRVPNLVPLTTTNATKAAQVDALALAFERDAVQIIPDPVLLRELGTFVAAKLPSGLMRYAASGKNHDDCVMMLLIGYSGVAHSHMKLYVMIGQPAPDTIKRQQAKTALDRLFGVEDPITVDAMFERLEAAR